MITFSRKLSVGKTDAYELDVVSWLNGEQLILDGIVEAEGLLSVVGTEVVGTVIKVLLTGATEGLAVLHFEYSTPTRSDCYKAGVHVVADC